MLLHRMALVSVRLFCKNLGNLQEFFGQMVYRPPWQKIARTPMLSILHGLALEVTTTKREAMPSRRRCQQNAILLLACVALFVLFKWLFVSKIFGKNEKCLVYSPAYPSAGGPGCSRRCVEKEGKKTAMYGAVFHGDSHQTWRKILSRT